MGVRVRQKVKGKGKPWYVFVSHQGKRYSKSIGTKKEAEKVASDIRVGLGNGKFNVDSQKPQPTFGEYAVRWLRFVESQTRGDNPTYRESTLFTILERGLVR